MDATAQHVSARATFTGDAKRFFRIALVGNLLQIPTFGFYRFWLITDIRRHLWSHTLIGGEAFEYTGRARELLIGFLIAMAILVPLYVGYFMLSIEAERWKAFASLPLLLIIYVLMQYGSFRARRYRATRTIFRGVRFWMTGSGWSYAGRAILWDLLTLITLGLALPWRMAALERYKMQHTRFGDLPGAFVGTGGTLFKRGWWLWLLGLGLFVGLFGASIAAAVMAAKNQSLLARQVMAFMPMITVLGTMIIIYPLFRAVQLRWWLDGIRFGELTLICTLKKRSIWWCYMKATLLGFVLSILCVGLLVAILASSSLLANVASPEAWKTFMASSLTGFVILAAFYVVFIFGLSLILLQVITRGVWRLTANSVTVFNLGALDAATARGMAAGSLGEGLADALDFGGGIGV